MDNTPINATTVPGGVAVRDIEKGGAKTQVVALDLGGAGAESLLTGTMPVSGTVALDASSLAALESVSVANFPATQPVSGEVSLSAASLAALETVSIANFPATQPVSGTVAVNNFPATQPVSGTVALDAASLSALETISVANFPATQPVSGTVALDAATLTALETTNADYALDGTDGATPPTIPGTGIRGWLRAIYEKLFDVTDTVNSPITAAHPVIDTRAILFAVSPGGVYGNIERTTGGNLKVAVEEFDSPLPTGTNTLGSVRLTNGTTTAGMEPFGALQVNNGFQTLFYDSWSSSPIDTTDKWTVTGTAPTIAGGNMTMPAALSSYHAIQTKDTIRPNVGFTLVRNGIQLEAAVATGCGRFWGKGTPASIPSAISLAQNGIGYEIDQATGALLAVTYTGGVRTTVATLTRPTDGAIHAYGCYFRVTQAYWVLDGVTVASATFPDVTVVELPALIVRQNAAAFTGTPVFVNIAHLTADTSRQGVVLNDPVIGTRQMRVDATGAARTTVSGNGLVSTANSSATPLAANGVFTGAWEDVTEYSTVILSVFSSHASATDGLAVQFSSDGVNPDLLDPFNIPAGTGKNFSFGVVARFYRVVYTNGPTAQTAMRMQTLFSKTPKKFSNQRPQDGRGLQNDFEEYLSYLMAYNGTSFDMVRSSAKSTQGAFALSTQDFKDAGRSSKSFTIDALAVVAAETIASVSLSTDNGTVVAATSHTVTAGKRLRMESATVSLSTVAGNTTAVSVTVRIRAIATAPALVGSPLQVVVVLPGVAAANGASSPVVIPFPDGWELPAGAGLAVTIACAGFVATTAAPRVSLAMNGYEY